MSNIDDLLGMLGIHEDPNPEPKQVTITTKKMEQKQEDSKPTEFFPTVISVDHWDESYGVELCNNAAEGTSQLQFEDWTDFYALAFKPDPLTQPCSDQRRTEFVTQMLETPEYKSLHTSTMLNVPKSEIAAVSFAESYSKLLEKDKKRESKYCKGGKVPDPEKMRELAEEALFGAVLKATQKAEEEVGQLEEVEQAFGIGGEPGDPSKMDAKEVAKLFKKVRNSWVLRTICERSGKFIRLARSLQRNKVVHGYDDVVGVELSGDVGRLLPSELVKLADPDFEDDAMRRLVEKQCMSRQYKGVEPVGKGPVIFVVDESGSMQGEKIANAKAFALSMAWIAKHQKRWCALIAFSGGTAGNVLELPPKSWDEEKLVGWLEHFYGRGTDMDVPLVELPNKYWAELKAPRGKTDVIILTDGLCNISKPMEESFNSWKKKESVRVISLILGESSVGDLSRVSDEAHLLDNIDITEKGVQSCLSI